MPRWCSVAGCPSGRDPSRKSHFFRAPKDPDDFNKWKTALSRDDSQLKAASTICHQHFLEDEVIKQTSVRLPDGSVLLSLPLSRWRLKPHSIPSRNLSLSTCKSRNNNVESTSAKTADCVTALLEMQNKTHPEVQDILSEAVSDIGINSAATQQCLMVLQLDKELEEDKTTGPAIIPLPDTQSDTVTTPIGKRQLIDINQDESPLTTYSPLQVKQGREFQEAAKYHRLFKKWQQRYYRMKKKFEKLEDKVEREGVYVSFSNLNPREQMYVTALAAKSHSKRLKRRRKGTCSISMREEDQAVNGIQ